MNRSDGELFRSELAELLASETFLRAPTLARLLSYLVTRTLAGEASTLKEVVIGHALYDRPADYDSKLDSVVRVNANRLRLRLEDHYRSQSAAKARIVLPKGTYVPLLELREDIPSEASDASISEETVDNDKPQQATIHDHETPETPLWTAGHSGLRKPHLAFLSVSAFAAVLCLLFWMALRRPAAVVSAETTWNVHPFARLGGSQQFGDFSPDGSSIVFASTSTRDLNKSIYVQSVTADEAHRLASGTRPSWSPDGKSIAFLRLGAESKKQVILYSLATGAESVVAELEGRWPWLCQLPHLSWSPDSSVIYASASTGVDATCGVVAIDVSTHRVRRVTEPSGALGDLEASVSPDGNTVAFLRGSSFAKSDIFIAPTNGGMARRITHDSADIVGFDWTRDGSGFVIASNREGGMRRLWKVPKDGGAPKAITDGSSAPTFPAVSAAGDLMSFTQFHVSAPIWRMESGKQIKVLDNQSLNSTPAVSPDGSRMLYTSNRSGKGTLWQSNVDGTGSKQFLRDGDYQTGAARWSPDGKRIVFECSKSGTTHICLSDSEGNSLRQLTDSAANDILPSWSRDGAYVYYTSNASGRDQIYRMDAVTGSSIQMTFGGGCRAIESWSGQWLYVARGIPAGGMVALPLRGNQQEWRVAEAKVFLQTMGADTSPDWDAGRVGIIYRVPTEKPASPQLVLFDVEKGKTSPLLTLSELPAGTDLTVSVMPDGRSVIYSAENTQTELNIMVAAEKTMPRYAGAQQNVSLETLRGPY